jgi:hypothetical protein
MKRARLKKVVVSRSTWKTISADHRFSVLLLGQIYNEITMLHRMSVACRKPPGDDSPQTDAMYGQLAMLTRLICGKLYESHIAINSKAVSLFMREHCFPLEPEEKGLEKLKEFNRLISSAAWLERARNGHSMHFPTQDQWDDAISASLRDGGAYTAIVGDVVGDSFYLSSAEIASLSFYSAAGPTWREGLRTFASDTVKLTSALSALIRAALDPYFRNLCRTQQRGVRIKDAKQFEMPRMSDFYLPYYFDFEPSKKN